MLCCVVLCCVVLCRAQKNSFPPVVKKLLFVVWSGVGGGLGDGLGLFCSAALPWAQYSAWGGLFWSGLVWFCGGGYFCMCRGELNFVGVG